MRRGHKCYESVTFPRMGPYSIIFRAILEKLGVRVIIPPPVSSETIRLGVRHSPECACFPLKMNIGNYLEAARLGAQAVVMVGGVGPCRLGYYAEVQREILADLGVDLELVVLEPPSRGWGQLAESLRRLSRRGSLADVGKAVAFGIHKLHRLDGLHAMAHHVRPREVVRGATSLALADGERLLDQAVTFAAVDDAGRLGQNLLAAVPVREGVRPVRVGLIGEVFMIFEPAVNGHTAETLGHLGAEVEQSVTLSDWVANHLAPGPWKRRGDRSESHYRKLAAPYLGFSVGGEGQPNIGHTIDMARRGVDGIVHLAPFTCMPEIVARTVLNTVSQDYGIPVLTFFLDEHSGETGMQTRLEAFVDLLERRRGAGIGGIGGDGVANPKEVALGGEFSE